MIQQASYYSIQPSTKFPWWAGVPLSGLFFLRSFSSYPSTNKFKVDWLCCRNGILWCKSMTHSENIPRCSPCVCWWKSIPIKCTLWMDPVHMQVSVTLRELGCFAYNNIPVFAICQALSMNKVLSYNKMLLLIRYILHFHITSIIWI